MVTSSSSNDQANPRGGVEHQIRDMVSTLTRRLTNLGNATTKETEHGVRVITLAGENKGAMMKDAEEMVDVIGSVVHKNKMAPMSAYTNSNYQAINNSIAMGGSLAVEDPGIHVVISDFFEEDEEEKVEKKSKEKKQKDKKNKGDVDVEDGKH